MKKFEAPRMSVLKLEMEDVMRTSGMCMVEADACTACYCETVQCDSSYVCSGQVCAILDTL